MAHRGDRVGDIAGLAAQLTSDVIDGGATHGQTLVFLAVAVGLVGQAFFVGVDTWGRQRARLRNRGLWIAATMSLLFLLAALYLPGLNSALTLEYPAAADWTTALGCAAAAWITAQAGAAFLRRSAAGFAGPGRELVFVIRAK